MCAFFIHLQLSQRLDCSSRKEAEKFFQESTGNSLYSLLQFASPHLLLLPRQEQWALMEQRCRYYSRVATSSEFFSELENSTFPPNSFY